VKRTFRRQRDNCPTRKARYRSEADARTALSHARSQRRNGLEHRQEARVYYCNLCHGYHLTSREK
jgi:hypothetical protein